MRLRVVFAKGDLAKTVAAKKNACYKNTKKKDTKEETCKKKVNVKVKSFLNSSDVLKEHYSYINRSEQSRRRCDAAHSPETLRP